MTDTANEIDPYAALQDKEPAKPPRNQWLDVWDQFKKHKGAVFGGGFLVFITLAVLLGPYLWTVDAQKLDIRNKNVRPIWIAVWDGGAKTLWHRPFGTDNLGRDLLAQMIAGGRASMAVGWTAMLLSLSIGTGVGVAAGYFKRLDGLLMRLTDLFLSLPILPLLLVAVTLFRQPLRANFGPEGGMFILIVVVVGLTSWMQTARIVRGEILALKEREFILAARLPIRLPNMGQNAGRRRATDGRIPRARLASRHRHLANRTWGELPRRRPARRARPPHPRTLTLRVGFTPLYALPLAKAHSP